MGGRREEEVEEISISGSFPCSHAHLDISQLNIITELLENPATPQTLDNNLNSVMSVNECFPDLIKLITIIIIICQARPQDKRQCDLPNRTGKILFHTGILDIDHSE